MTLAIDFDMVLHQKDKPVPGRKMGLPIPGAKEALVRLMREGHTVIIHSCFRAEPIAAWMAYYEIPYSTIWQSPGKPNADCFLDDKGVRFTGWDKLGPDPKDWR